VRNEDVAVTSKSPKAVARAALVAAQRVLPFYTHPNSPKKLTQHLGPDTPPLGERTNCDRVTQSQIAVTLAALLGEDYHGAGPHSGQAILPPAD
jgi:hypothetical protein